MDAVRGHVAPVTAPLELPFPAAGVREAEGRATMSDGVTLRLLNFEPAGPARAPLVIFVAGWLSSVEDWRPVLDVLTSCHRVLYVETREKTSAWLPAGRRCDFSMERLRRDLAEVLEARVPAGSPFCLMGSSLGSTVILEYLSRVERRPHLTLLVAPTITFRLPSWVRITGGYLPISFVSALKPVAKWYLRHLRLDPAREPEQAAGVARNIDRAEPGRLRAIAMALDAYAGWDMLARVSAPVIVVAGATDRLHDLDTVRKIVSMMPDARLHMMASNRETHSPVMGHWAADVFTTA